MGIVDDIHGNMHKELDVTQAKITDHHVPNLPQLSMALWIVEEWVVPQVIQHARGHLAM
jgi:hypothetical protein